MFFDPYIDFMLTVIWRSADEVTEYSDLNEEWKEKAVHAVPTILKPFVAGTMQYYCEVNWRVDLRYHKD